MIKNVVILGAGILIGYFLIRKADPMTTSVVKPGDKSKDIEGMQKAFGDLAGFEFDQYGQYDNDTRDVAQYLLEGTDALVDSNKGSINASFVKDISKMHYNSLKNTLS